MGFTLHGCELIIDDQSIHTLITAGVVTISQIAINENVLDMIWS